MKIICPIFYQRNDRFLTLWKEMNDSRCDLIEVRLDRALSLQEDLDFEWLNTKKKPVLLTIRTQEEGGEVDLSQKEYERWIEILLDHGDLVDVQVERMFPLGRRDKIVLSYHDFDQTPSNLEAIWKKMEKEHCAIEKIALMPKSEQDVLDLLLSCKEHKTDAEKIAISMGEKGKISRVLSDLFGSSYSFASFSESSAPGQIDLASMIELRSLIEQSSEKA